MLTYRNDCVSCDLPCIDCGRKHIKVIKCDYCGEEIDEGYRFEGEDYCTDCLKTLIVKRYFDIEELVEKYFKSRYKNDFETLWEIENVWNKKGMYEELYNEDVENLIEYLGINAYPVEEAY